MTPTRRGRRRSRITNEVEMCGSRPSRQASSQAQSESPGAPQGSRNAPETRPRFDLPGFVEHQLRAARVGRIERQSPCTFADDSRFFSYRRMTRRQEPDYGRQISAIVVA